MKQGKRILAMFLLVVTVFTMASFSVSAATPNTSDTTHTIQVNDDFTKNRAYRPKNNSTAIYLHIDNHIYVHSFVQAQGCTSSGGNRTKCTIVEGEVVAQVVCRNDIQYSIRNNVYEKGFACASLDFRHINNDTQNTTLTYTWSPDSAGSYIPAT